MGTPKFMFVPGTKKASFDPGHYFECRELIIIGQGIKYINEIQLYKRLKYVLFTSQNLN